jgi:hypothetical protein
MLEIPPMYPVEAYDYMSPDDEVVVTLSTFQQGRQEAFEAGVKWAVYKLGADLKPEGK